MWPLIRRVGRPQKSLVLQGIESLFPEQISNLRYLKPKSWGNKRANEKRNAYNDYINLKVE